jgi:putative nucleotidyltransferase with HDIG domain
MFDFIKRAQLHKQGLSCGRIRRKHFQGAVWDTLRCNPLVGMGIFAGAFILTAALLHFIAQGLGAQGVGYSSVFVGAVFLTAALHWHVGLPTGNRTNGLALLTLTVVLVHLAAAGIALSYGHRYWESGYSLLLAPHALAPMVLCMLGGRRLGLYAAVYVSLLGATLVEDSAALPYVATGLGVGFVAVFASQRIRRRSSLLAAGLYSGMVASAFMVFFGRIYLNQGGGDQVVLLLLPLIVGLLTPMLASFAMPVFEKLFHVTSDISWLELGDLNHPLMKRLSIEAPGTYHHSLVVASLSEAAAEAIGANATMCRVCSYFHDIGKLTKPEYFIENMDPEDNPHDDLTARMSALVLIAHVKDGVDMALKNGLNNRIADVIEQHHGNSLAWYFYRRALDQKKEALRLVEQDKAREDDVPDVTEDGFRYPGPKPQFKESAIISLADAVESTSRTLAKPNPGRVEQMVEDIVRTRLLDRQLDECDLTLAELAEVKTSFVKTLLSMMHNRVKYPKENAGMEREEETRQETRQETRVVAKSPKAAA